MDWSAAIEKNREALKRVLAMLVGMAALPILRACGDAGTSGGGATLPRRLHRAVMRLLRPAEAAARRLVIVAARGLVVPLPPPRKVKPKPKPTILRAAICPGILVPPHLRPGASSPRTAPRTLSLSLFDPLPRWPGRVRVEARGVPRISTHGLTEPFPIPRPPAPDDPIDAGRLALRLQALGRVLDDLPAQARRFARWRARRDAGLVRRVSPLRGGRPPGGRRRPTHQVHDILNVVHGLAHWALERSDSS